MKTIITFILLAVLTACSQRSHLVPGASAFDETSETINPFVKLLHLKDTNSVILRVATTNRNEPHTGDFLVQDTKGDITFYMVLIKWDTLVYSKRLTKAQRDTIADVFVKTASIDKSVVQNTTGMTIYDAWGVDVELYKNRYAKKISSYAPYEYIEENIGAEERKKLLNVYHKACRYNHLPAKSSKELTDIDTVYVHFTYGKLQVKEPPFKKNVNKTYLYHASNSSFSFFYQTSKDSVEVPRSFLKTHKNQIVDQYYLLKNPGHYANLSEKTLYIIDDNGKNLYLKQVKYGSLF